MNNSILTARLGTIFALLITAGCGGSSPFQDASYDDCVLKYVAKAPNESAVELMRESCLRKFTIAKNIPLEVTKSLNSNYKITISNNSNFIVTQVALDAGSFGEWEQAEWIEPHGWVDFDPPEGNLEIVRAAKNGKIKAKSLRVIEVGVPPKSE